VTDVEALYGAAVRELPGVRIDLAAFERAWASRAVSRDIDPKLALDVLLAAGIEAGDGASLRWLQAQVARAAGALRDEAQRSTDVESRVLELVAVGQPERPARITEYAALGPLAAWVNVIVVRTARDLAARSPSSVARDLAEFAIAEIQTSTSAELAPLKARLADDLGFAIRSAGGKLDQRSRTLLTLYYLEGVGLEGLARAWNVHRATISRWLATAREAFLADVRREFAVRAGVGSGEVDTLIRFVRSQLEVSVSRLFGTR
jgi:RNA polymerase sigma-70 factor, ECF subfamily